VELGLRNEATGSFALARAMPTLGKSMAWPPSRALSPALVQGAGRIIP
jgi:hypothetical protein